MSRQQGLILNAIRCFHYEHDVASSCVVQSISTVEYSTQRAPLEAFDGKLVVAHRRWTLDAIVYLVHCLFQRQHGNIILMRDNVLSWID